MTSVNHDQQIANELGSRINRAIDESLAHAGVGIERFVTSWEGFSGNPRLAYQNANAVASMLRESTKSLDVRIIVYLRRQDEFVESMYTQTIHEGGSFAVFVCDGHGLDAGDPKFNCLNSNQI